MQIINGNLWDELGIADRILVTTNADVNARGDLVMGRGAALQARQMFPGLPRELGYRVKAFAGNYHRTPSLFAHPSEEELPPEKRMSLEQLSGGPQNNLYGILWSSYKSGKTESLGAFQVKLHWNQPAELWIIQHSVRILCAELEQNQWGRVAMNFPGTGNGRLDEEQVLPIIQALPDSVVVYKFDEATAKQHSGQKTA